MRHFSVPRQAYLPRIWSQVLVGAVLAWCMVYSGLRLGVPWFVCVPLALLVGPIVPAVRWRVWKRRHPVVTDYVTEQRKAAPWQ